MSPVPWRRFRNALSRLDDAIGGFFQNDAYVVRAAGRWADAYFPDHRREAARAVVLGIARVLCVPVDHVKPEADLAKDLGANEDWEWEVMQLHLEETMGKKFPPHLRIVGPTVSDLINFTCASLPIPRK
jgi:hypothetical protein